jgi:hypothetical protein
MALPSPSGEPNLLGPIDRASLYRWALSIKHAGHIFQLCEDLVVSYKVDSIKIIIALLSRYKTYGEWDKISVPQMRQ